MEPKERIFTDQKWKKRPATAAGRRGVRAGGRIGNQRETPMEGNLPG